MAKQKSTALDVTRPIDNQQLTQAVRWASESAGLSRWERHKLEAQVKRQRAELIQRLTEVEHQTILSEALAAAEGRIEAAEERAAAEAFVQRLRCLTEAARFQDEALIAVGQCSEDTAQMMSAAVMRVTGQYVRGMEARAAGFQ